MRTYSNLRGTSSQDGQKLKDQVQQDIRTYGSFRDDMAVIDGIIMKGRHVENTGARPTPHQSNGDRKNKTPGTGIYILGQHE